jgi:hypothetical protein
LRLAGRVFMALVAGAAFALVAWETPQAAKRQRESARSDTPAPAVADSSTDFNQENPSITRAKDTPGADRAWGVTVPRRKIESWSRLTTDESRDASMSRREVASSERDEESPSVATGPPHSRSPP